MIIVVRPSWDEVWMDAARSVARRSLCSRAQVGAAVVTEDNRVEALAYNGPAPAFDHQNQSCEHWCFRSWAGTGHDLDPRYEDCWSSHAEASAIARSDWSNIDGGTVYATGSVCFGCAKLITQTKIARVVHCVNPGEEHRSPEFVEEYLGEMGVAVERWGDDAA